MAVHFNVSDQMLRYVPKEDIQEYNHVPQLIRQHEGAKWWHLEMPFLKLEQHSLHLMIYSSESFKTPEHNVYNLLMEKYMHQLLSDQFFDINALYTAEVSASLEGMLFSFQGPGQQLNRLVTDFFQALHDGYSIPQQKF